MAFSIDIIIPSFRLQEQYLLPILDLKKPGEVQIKYYLISDNPTIVLSEALTNRINNEDVILIVNSSNLGAAATRNRGIDAGDGTWILFLDDDIEVQDDLLLNYTAAIQNYQEEIGFIGLVNMPSPPTTFAKALELMGATGIFSVAKAKESYAWGATANMIIRRSAIKDLRFSENYPKFGGGEEVDFFLRVREKNGFKNYKSLPGAAVTHPWWHNGKRNYKQFYYGRGNSYLPQFNPQYKFYDFLNTSETMFAWLIISVVFLILNHLKLQAIGLVVLLIILIEFIANMLRVYLKTRKINFELIYELMTVRNAYEFGILYENLSRLRFTGIGERFRDDGSFKRSGFALNKYKIIKLSLYGLVIIYLIYSAS
ncbi:glycosyltransferase [Pedobacter sp. HMF7647]|uniref:Glycosyltransferase n=1 Tax=Hufsiella arboris TaxID=2695275 RepID=A0A7K1Y615_9SPHI|nr:glycosyltransferase [Hufsiella arboris]MXV50015.1 glycosyltransferase [Hufsiella arboris]